MQKHIKVYIDYFDICEQDVVKCEICGKQRRVDKGGFDIHHINGRIGKDANNIENLILLCRKCHTDVHEGREEKYIVVYAHKVTLAKFRK